MKVICKYDRDLEAFLKKTVRYTLNKYGKDLNLSRLEKIELKSISEFEIETDGRSYDGTTIIVTSRLYDTLPSHDIRKLKSNKDFRVIVNTLYHELGHISDWTEYPTIYKYGSEMEEPRRGLPALFWLEYLAEKRSFNTGENDKSDFCTQFVERKWHPYKCDFEHASIDNFFYLNKSLPYFIVGISDKNAYEYYIGQIDNKMLVEYIDELIQELNRLETLLPFDDVDILANLYKIMNDYYKRFKKKYTSRRTWI